MKQWGQPLKDLKEEKQKGGRKKKMARKENVTDGG